MTQATSGWLWGTRRSVALKAGGVALVALVSVGGATLGALNAPYAAADGPTDALQAVEMADPSHGVLGFIMTKRDDQLTIRTRQGKAGTVHIGPDTVVRRGKQRVTLDDIRPGDRIAAIGIPRAGVRPPVMDAKVIILRPARKVISGTRPAASPQVYL